MSRRMIKPKATVKSTARDAEKYLSELQGINQRLQSANGQLLATQRGTYESVKMLEQRLKVVENHLGLSASSEKPVEEVVTDAPLEGPGVVVPPPSESVDVLVQDGDSVPVQAVEGQ